MTESLFNFFSLLPLPIWASMLLFPRRRFTQQMVLSYWPYIVLGGLYTLLLIGSLASGSGSFDFSFQGLRQGFSQEWTFLAAWTHYLCFDLFVGVWIFRDAKYWGINPGIYLLLTLFLGPLGLASYLLMRQRRSKKDTTRVLN